MKRLKMAGRLAGAAVWLAALAVMPTAAQGNVVITPDTAAEVEMLGAVGPGNAVSAVFSPNGKLIAVATTAGVKLYETAAFGVEDVLDGGGFPANAVAFSPDGTQLAATSVGYNVRAFDVNTGALIADEYPDDLDGALGTLAIDPTGETVALGAGDAMNVYEADSSERRFQAIGHESNITQIAYSPDGTLIATASWDGTARIWNKADGGFLVALTGHTEGVMSVSWLPDGSEVITASEDGTVRRWNAATGEELGTIFTHEGGGPMVAALRPEGGYLIVGDHHGELTLISGDNYEFVGTLGTQRGEIRSVAFSPDGRTVASVSPDQVMLYDVATVSGIGSVDFQPAFTALDVSADGSQVALGGADGALAIYNVGDSAPAHTYAIGMPPVTALALGPDGMLYVGSMDSNVAVIDMHNSVELAPLAGTAAVVDLTMHPTIPMVNAAMADGALRWWGTNPVEEFGTAYTHDGALTATAFSPDGAWMASADDGGAIFVWGVESSDFEFTLDGAGAQVNDMVFSADGSMLAAALEDGRTGVWQLASPTAPAVMLTDFFGPVYAAAFSPDMALVAAAGGDGIVRLFNAATGETLNLGYGHNATVNDLAFSPDGTRLYSAGGDGLVMMWGVP